MTEHRYDAHAEIDGACELSVDGRRLQLITLTLTDGSDTDRDVICPLRPSEARRLAHRLLTLADHATRPAVAG